MNGPQIMQDKLNMDTVKEFLRQPVPSQILFFDVMFSTRLLQLVYWAALVAVVWGGLGRLFSGSFYGFARTVFAFGSGRTHDGCSALGQNRASVV